MAKNGLVAWFDNLPWIVKVIFCLPGLDILWAIYRIFKGVTESNVLLLVLGLVWLFVGTTVTWVLDLITTLFLKRPILS